MATLFGLTQSQVERLSRLLDSYEAGELAAHPSPSPDPRWLDTDHVIVGYLDSAISGIINLNSNPNAGTLSVYSFTTTGQTDTTINEKVYHFATISATTDRWTMAKRDRTTGKYVIDYQACSTT